MKKENFVVSVVVMLCAVLFIGVGVSFASPWMGTDESDAQVGSWFHVDGNYLHGYVENIGLGDNVVFSKDGGMDISAADVGYSVVAFLNSSRCSISSEGSGTSNMEYINMYQTGLPSEIADASLLNYGQNVSGSGIYSVISYNTTIFGHILNTDNYAAFYVTHETEGFFDYEYVVPFTGADFSGFDCTFGEMAPPPVQTPLPAAGWLFASGLPLLLAARRKK